MWVQKARDKGGGSVSDHVRLLKVRFKRPAKGAALPPII